MTRDFHNHLPTMRVAAWPSCIRQDAKRLPMHRPLTGKTME